MIEVVGAGGTPAVRELAFDLEIVGLNLNVRSLVLTTGAANGAPTKRGFTVVDLMGECIGIFHRPREGASID
jgi:hypothetical protein